MYMHVNYKHNNLTIVLDVLVGVYYVIIGTDNRNDHAYLCTQGLYNGGVITS